MTEDEILAGNVKYASALVAHIAEIRPGVFAMWQGNRDLLLITEDFGSLLLAYRSRPPIIRREPINFEKRVIHGIDTSSITFTL